jgi:membrane dipeptidase
MLSLAQTAAQAANPDPNAMTEIRTLLREVPLIDGHNDLPWQFRHQKKSLNDIDLSVDTTQLAEPLITDIPRLRKGGMGAQFWSVYVPVKLSGADAVKATLEQIDLVHRLVASYPDTLAMANTAADIERIHREGRIASLIAMEGGHCIDNSLAVLRTCYALGARYMTLTHVKNTDWADAAFDEPRHHGLTPFGESVVREMNRLGMMVDLSHVTDETMRAALRVSSAPIIFSHSGARGVCESPRNVLDDILQMVKANGGVVMVCFLPGYLNNPNAAFFVQGMAECQRLEKLHPDDDDRVDQEMEKWRRAHPAPPASLVDVANHIDHIRKVIGIDYVGLGSDFEGFHGSVAGLEDVSCYPALLAELRGRGYSLEEIKKVAGLNLLRVMKQVEAVAAREKLPEGAR